MKTAVAIRHVAFEDLGVFAEVLRERGFELKVLDAGVDDLTSIGTTRPELLIVLGGPLSVNDERVFPFLVQEKALLRSWLAEDRPCLGICLGAQLMSVALGGTVGSMGVKEIGWSPLELSPEGRASALSELGENPHVLHWHGESFSLPAGAKLLASTAVCTNQAFAWGRRGLGLQFHVEADPRTLERWYIGHIGELEQAKISPVELRVQAQAHAEQTSERARVFLSRWLDELEL